MVLQGFEAEVIDFLQVLDRFGGLEAEILDSLLVLERFLKGLRLKHLICLGFGRFVGVEAESFIFFQL